MVEDCSTVCIFTTLMYNNSSWLMPSIIKVWRRRHESIMNQPQVLIKVFVLSYLHNSHGVYFQQNGSLYLFLFFIKRNYGLPLLLLILLVAFKKFPYYSFSFSWFNLDLSVTGALSYGQIKVFFKKDTQSCPLIRIFLLL